METTEETSHRRGGTYYYFEGATIHNLVINGNMSKTGPEYHGQEHEPLWQ